MSNKKLKPTHKQSPLEEAHTLGYLEGHADGRLEILKELIKFRLLKKDWKGVYNKKTKQNYLIK